MAAASRQDNPVEDFNPFLDMTGKFEQFRMPGVDMPSFIEARRKDVAALVIVNKMAYEILQAIGHAQADMTQLAEVVRKSQVIAMAALTERAHENLSMVSAAPQLVP